MYLPLGCCDYTLLFCSTRPSSHSRKHKRLLNRVDYLHLDLIAPIALLWARVGKVALLVGSVHDPTVDLVVSVTGQVALQALIAILVLAVSLRNLDQAVPDEELVVSACVSGMFWLEEREILPCGKDRGRYVHQNTDPTVGVVVCESLTTEEDSGYDSGTQVPGGVGGDGVSGKAPDHSGVDQTNSKRYAGWSGEWICRVKAGPDNDGNERVDEELLEEDVALVRLVWVGVGAQYAGDTTVVVNSAYPNKLALIDSMHWATEIAIRLVAQYLILRWEVVLQRSQAQRKRGLLTMSLQVECLSRLNLRPVATHENQACHECSKDLGEDVVRDLLPREALPDGETDSDGRIEMPTTDWCHGNDGKGDTDSESPANLEQRTEDIDTYLSGDWVRGCESERSYRGDTREDVEEDTCGFCHALTKDTWTAMFESQLALRDRLWWYNMAGNVALQGISGTKLYVVGMKATHILLVRSIAVLLLSHVDAGLLFSRLWER